MPQKLQKLIPCWLLLLIPVVLLVADPGAWRSFNAPKQLLLILGGLSGLVGWLGIAWYRHRRIWLWWSGLELLLLARLGWLVTTRPSWAVHPSDAGFWLLLSLTLLALLTAWSYQAGNSARHIWDQWFLPVLTGSLALVALIGLGQHIAFWEATLPASVKTPVVGTIGAANGFGLLMSMGLLCSGWYLLPRHHQSVRYGSGILLALFGLALGLNGSRGALLSLAGAAGIAAWMWVMYMPPTGRWTAVIPILQRWRHVAAGVLLVLIALLGGWLYQLDTESSRGRLMVWELSLPMITEHPVTGIGQGRYGVEYLDYQARYFAQLEHSKQAWKAAHLKQAHNEYLQAFAESGIPGGLLFVGIWAWVGWRYVKAIKDGRNNEHMRVRQLLYLALLLLILLHSLLDTPLHVLPVSLIAYLLIGLAPVEHRECSITAGWKQVVIILPLTGLCQYGILRPMTQYQGYRLWQEGVERAEKHEWPAAISSYRSALAYLPEKGELLFHLGSALVMNKKYSKGLYYLDEAEEHFSDRNLYLSKSHARLELGHVKRAEEQALKARAMFPDHLAPRLLLARIAHRRGHHEEARRHLEACINQGTSIHSNQTRQIAADARRYHWLWYGKTNINQANSSQ